MGDFNDILASEEKSGGLEYLSWLLVRFCSAILDYGLQDIALEGHPFTWSQGKGGNEAIKKRLDRAMITQDWLDSFPRCKLHNLITTISYQSPLLLVLVEQEEARR